MRFQSIASGSSGNCIYAGSANTHLLMDVGISRKRTNEALHGIGLDLREIDGIFLTHEHADHVTGLPVIARNTEMPIYATRGTIDAILQTPKGSQIAPDRFVCVRADEPVEIGDLRVDPMRISHDAAEPVGYRIYEGDKKACVCTDLGCYTDYTMQCLEGSDVLLIESNHDINMLQVGHYPYRLKQRILGNRGHLSNASSGQLLSRILNDHMKGIFLGHLSQENNLPELAFETVRVEILFSESGYRPEDLPIQVAKRSAPSALVEF
ncbi:MAG: MBL fold metallo-hydrolase [Eubacteriales bacterium]|nr:MBL fold metallo-hydrolase [Eubacteriales bacterium]